MSPKKPPIPSREIFVDFFREDSSPLPIFLDITLPIPSNIPVKTDSKGAVANLAKLAVFCLKVSRFCCKLSSAACAIESKELSALDISISKDNESDKIS